MKKEVYQIKDLEELGYPVNLLRELSHSEDFHMIGFRGLKNSYYFYKEKLDKYLERRTLWND